jgi:hypothetical protein
MLASTPDQKLLVLDAKASDKPFDASEPALRALGEYVRRQSTRQTGGVNLYAAVVIAKEFKQDAETLAATSTAFYSSYGVPVSFLEADLLADMCERMRHSATLRNAVRWSRLFAGGYVAQSTVETEFRDAEAERYSGTET